MEILRRLALLVLAGAAGCEFVHEPTPLGLTGEQVSVHSVLRADSDTVSVLLERVDPTASPHGTPETRPVSGAGVRIVTGSTTVRLSEAPTGFPRCFSPYPREGKIPPIAPGCYAAIIPGGVREGARYELQVDLPGGGAIRGSAVVPGKPDLLSPAEGARFEVARGYNTEGLGRIPVRLRAPAGAAGIEVGLRPVAAFEGGRQVQSAICDVDHPLGVVRDATRSDSVVVPIFGIACVERVDSTGRNDRSVALDSLRVELLVTAYDTAYTRYAALLGRGSAERSRASAGVSGAVGVFAGVASTRRTLVLVPVRK